MVIYPRTVTEKLLAYLYTRDVIVLHGARQVGKTHILLYLQELLVKKKESVYYLDLEDSRFVRILDAGHEKFTIHLREEGFDFDTTGKKKLFVLIDEIQYLRNPSSFLKIVADHYPGIKLIVSGSSSFDIKTKFKDSLVGRTVNFDIFNLSFKEFILFKNQVFDASRPYTEKKAEELQTLYREYVRYGGYPKIVLTTDRSMKEKYLQQIIDTYVKKDIRDLAGIRDIGKFNKLIEVLAAQSGQLLNIAELASTCSLAKQTVEHYLFLLEQTYVIRLVRPFSTNKRAELFKTPKIFFYDTGLMQMLWLKELPRQILGQAFETSVFAELVKQYGGDAIHYWRTADKKEIDFILRQGKKIVPIEAKLNFSRFNRTAMDYFSREYHPQPYRVTGLEQKPDNTHAVYPWEL